MAILKAPQPVEAIDEVLHPCEAAGCTVQTPQHSAFSFIVVMQMVDRDGRYAWFQCANEQHWACTHSHAVEAAHACIDECHSEANLVLAPPDIKVRLKAGETCAICGTSVGPGSAYHLPVAYATPGLGYGAYACSTGEEHFHPNMHWCCSEAHAKTAAKACIEEHLSSGQHG